MPVIEDDVVVANPLRRRLGLKGIKGTITECSSTGREPWKSGDFDPAETEAKGRAMAAGGIDFINKPTSRHKTLEVPHLCSN